MKKFLGLFISTILIEIVKLSVNNACISFTHQPEIPEMAMEYSKLDD